MDVMNKKTPIGMDSNTGEILFDIDGIDDAPGSAFDDEATEVRALPASTSQGVLTTRPEGSWMTHALKTWPDGFQAVVDGRKTHETRSDDRHFQVGDELILREYVPPVDKGCKVKSCALCVLEAKLTGKGYTGRFVRALVTYVSRGLTPYPKQHLTPGSVVLSIKLVEVVA